MNTDYVKLLYQCKTHASLYSEMEIIYLILLMISCVTILIFLFYSILVFDLLRDLAHLITMFLWNHVLRKTGIAKRLLLYFTYFRR